MSGWPAVGLYQQQQPAASGKDDRRGAGKSRHRGGLSGWQQASLQL